MSETQASALRQLIDRVNRTEARDLHIEVGKHVQARSDGELKAIDGATVTASTFDALIAPFRGVTESFVMAYAGWYRVVVDGTALVVRPIPSRMYEPA